MRWKGFDGHGADENACSEGLGIEKKGVVVPKRVSLLLRFLCWKFMVLMIHESIDSTTRPRYGLVEVTMTQFCTVFHVR